MSLSASLMVAALLLGVAAVPTTAERRSRGKRVQVRIAVRPDGLLYVAVAGSGWQFVEEGKTYRMKFVFGNGRAYEEELKAAAVGLEIVLLKPRMSAPFLSDFMEKTSLRVHCRDSPIESVLFSDTYDAVTQLRTCNASVAGAPDFTDPSLR